MEITFDGREFARLASLFANGDPIFRQSVKAALRRAGSGIRSGLSKGIRAKSYLRGKTVSSALGRLIVTNEEASVRVAARNQPAFKFKLSPNKITARKGVRSKNWQSPDVLKGPGLAPLNPRIAGFSKPFITKTKSGFKGMYVRERHTGRLAMPRIASPQYFSAFDAVKKPVMREAGETFLKRLNHEIDYRLGALR